MEQIVYRQCRTCMGTGIEQRGAADGNPVEVTCTACGGVGKREYLTVDLSDIEDKLNDIMDKCNDIFEKVNE